MDRFTLKPMSKDAVPSALTKAERYRLLNEPGRAPGSSFLREAAG